MARVLIVEDHTVVSDALEAALNATDGMVVAATTTDASMATLLCEQKNIDLALIDICAENGSSGIEACREIKRACPQVKVVLMTGMPEITFVDRARQAGAEGFVYKNTRLKNVIFTLQNTLAGYTTYPKQVETPLSNTTVNLTPHEIEVLRLFCDGKRRAEIAHELAVSEATLKKQITEMLSKTGFHSIAKLTSFALANDYINPKI